MKEPCDAYSQCPSQDFAAPSPRLPPQPVLANSYSPCESFLILSDSPALPETKMEIDSPTPAAQVLRAQQSNLAHFLTSPDASTLGIIPDVNFRALAAQQQCAPVLCVNPADISGPGPAPAPEPSMTKCEDEDVDMVDAEAISNEAVGDNDIADAEMNDSSLQLQDEASSRTASVPPLAMSDEVLPDVPCEDDAHLVSVHTVAGDHDQQTSPSSHPRRGSQSSAESRASTIRTVSPKEPAVEKSISTPQTPIARTITKPSQISVPPRSSPQLSDSLRAETASPVSSILDPRLQDLALSTPTEGATNGPPASTSHSSVDTASPGKTY